MSNDHLTTLKPKPMDFLNDFSNTFEWRFFSFTTLTRIRILSICFLPIPLVEFFMSRN